MGDQGGSLLHRHSSSHILRRHIMPPMSPISSQHSSHGSNSLILQAVHQTEPSLYDGCNHSCTSDYTGTHLKSPKLSVEPPASIVTNDNSACTDIPPSFPDSDANRILQELEKELLGLDDNLNNGDHCQDDDNDASGLIAPCLNFLYDLGCQETSSNSDGRRDMLSRVSKQGHSEVQSSVTEGKTSEKKRQRMSHQPSVPSSSDPSVGVSNVIKIPDIAQLLMSCAAAMADDHDRVSDILVGKLKQSVSIYGEPMERLAAYMVEGLVARRASSGRVLYRSLNHVQPLGQHLLSAKEFLYEVCPYVKFGYMAANGAIVEAMKDEKKVHIIDLQIQHEAQWVALIQALANRAGGPPYLRITGIYDTDAEHRMEGKAGEVGKKLTKLAGSVGVPFEFNTLHINILGMDSMIVEHRDNEAMAINCAFELHHMPDDGIKSRDNMLRVLKKMNPKVLTLVEQEADTNTADFFARFLECLDYYSAAFECIDSVLPRDSKARVAMEQHCLARDLVNLIACEGEALVERHEELRRWKLRLEMADFRPYPLSPYVNSTIKALLELYSKDYFCAQEEGNAIILGWLNRPLVAASAWC